MYHLDIVEDPCDLAVDSTIKPNVTSIGDLVDTPVKGLQTPKTQRCALVLEDSCCEYGKHNVK